MLISRGVYYLAEIEISTRVENLHIIVPEGHLQDKAMQEISEAMDSVLRKVRTRLYSGITN